MTDRGRSAHGRRAYERQRTAGALRIDDTQDGAQGDCARDDSARAGAMSAPIVEVRNLVKRYGDVVALDHFDLRIEPGEIFGLLGPNGSGKTTAINCILQLLTFDKGDICLFGEPMTPTRYDLKRKIGVVPQNVALFEELTVRENIDFFCALYVDDRRERARLVDEAIAFVGLEDYVKFRPRKLSGGLLRRSTLPAASPTGPGSPSSTSRRWRWIRRAATPFWRASAA